MRTFAAALAAVEVLWIAGDFVDIEQGIADGWRAGRLDP